MNMAKKNIPINSRDKNFAKLMGDVAKGLRKNDKKLVDKAKSEFADSDISLFYNEEKDLIRVLKQGRPPIDFEMSQWTKEPQSKVK